jgi:hypothetical protein
MLLLATDQFDGRVVPSRSNDRRPHQLSIVSPEFSIVSSEFGSGQGGTDNDAVGFGAGVDSVVRLH